MNVFSCKEGIQTEAGALNFPFNLTYHTYGILNSDCSNVKWVFHALTANSDAASWWSGLFGNNNILDPSRDFIICANMPGSCYGSTGPLSYQSEDQKAKYHHSFPFLTIRDIANCFHRLKEHLGVQQIQVGIGGSMGGSILLEWNVLFPDDFKNSILIATSGQESSWGKAIHTVHKMAIETDPTWKKSQDDAGIQGLETARGVGMLFYRTYESFNDKQIDENDTLIDYKSDSYIRYQGKKLTKRFNAFSYYFLLNSLDSHNLGRNREGLHNALTQIKSHCLIIGINSDILYPKEEQQVLHNSIPNSELHFIDSAYGHDGFLIETKQINAISNAFLNKE